KGRKGHYREEFEKLRKSGFTKVRVDGQIVELKPKMSLDRYKVHDIEVVIDKLTIKPENELRLRQSLELALKTGKGTVLTYNQNNQQIQWYCKHLMDPETGLSYEEPAPNSFSFNSPYGACFSCQGIGSVLQPDMKAIIQDPSLSISQGAMANLLEYFDDFFSDDFKYLAKKYKFKLNTPWQQLPSNIQEILLYGEQVVESDDSEISLLNLSRFQGILGVLGNIYKTTNSEKHRSLVEQFLYLDKCPECLGARLKKESLHFKVDNYNIAQLSDLDVRSLLTWLDGLENRLSPTQAKISTEILKEIRKRLGFLLEVGLDYLSLSRPTSTLSGGESQRIRLATQIGSQLVGVLYILDEPSIGLHQRDNIRLIQSLETLRDLGNTVLVVEHDKDMMLHADYIIDIGPGAGTHGGKIVAQGKPKDFLLTGSITADYLSGIRQIPVPTNRRIPGERKLILRNATGHNLKNVTVEIPLGLFVCVTGVSGSGKSSLINQTLYPILHKHSYGYDKRPLPYESIEGLEFIDKVIDIDQSPIGRTPRSNPATYTGLFTYIRDLFAKLPESQIRGYKPGRFSFNVKGGRCEQCSGAGLEVIEMNFLPDVEVNCPVCRGRRYNRETLEVRYKGKSIADVLKMTVSQALEFFEAHPKIKNKLQTLEDVGLGYISLGQSATTLSGGEAQRMKIAAELSKKATGKTIYILDEPTTGLHFQDIEKLLQVLNRLVQKGNTVLVIEHNLDIIKVADYVIDMGPEGGSQGGEIIATGTPEDIAFHPNSY
ncbi:MAG: excinuclease ABC subunit UvrA, partial [Bacteroidia bacterium]|nr:excinuclease ABC subunit UvrA [Bacteroidia bacterium]